MLPKAADVTIVVTTYKHAHFLGKALDSIKAQTVPVGEIIVVDDGSTDDPASVTEGFKSVRLIRQANQGLSAARNAGLKAANGAFIGFLDADDWLLPETVETNLRQFAANAECGFVYGAYQLVDAEGAVTLRPPLRQPGPDAYADFLTSNLVGMHGTVLYSREKLLEAGGFDSALRAVEDWDVYLKLTQKYPTAAQDKVLAAYRRHDANMTNDQVFMLDSALAVLGRQKSVARTREDLTEAFDRGAWSLRDYYVRQQLHALSNAAKTRTAIPQALADTMRMTGRAPRTVGRTVVAWLRGSKDAMKKVRFGDLRRTTPFDQEFGYGRGEPVDRYYVEAFLEANAADIQGRVLEIGDSSYTMRFGGKRVTQADVLNRYEGHPATTFVGDLSEGAGMPSDAFDCIVLTQTLHLLFDMPAAIATLHRVLRPGGVLLVTVPWISQIDPGEWGDDWMWSISQKALERLLTGPFHKENTRIGSYGNVLSATAFLYGLAQHELSRAELDVHDSHRPVLVAGRAMKAAQ